MRLERSALLGLTGLLALAGPPPIAQDNARKPIPLCQTSPSPASAAGWPFVTGIPVPRGALADARPAAWRATTRPVGGNDWVFLVPQGVGQFKAAFSEGAFILDPAWKRTAGQGDAKLVVISVSPEHAGKLWRFRPVGHDSRLKLEGIPPYVAPHPDYWFDVKR